jgi:hypothetical protein
MERGGRNRWQIEQARERRESPKTVAVGCDWLPRNGKEGVDGSSPSEGFTKSLPINSFR